MRLQSSVKTPVFTLNAARRASGLVSPGVICYNDLADTVTGLPLHFVPACCRNRRTMRFTRSRVFRDYVGTFKVVFLKRPSPSTRARSRQRAQRLVRTGVIGVACLLLLLGGRQMAAVSGVGLLLLLGLLFVARSVPVAFSHEHPVTFFAAFVFAAALLQGGVVAGASALAVCAAHAWQARRGSRSDGLLLGAEYALAALGAHTVFAWLAGPTPIGGRPALLEFGCICAAAAVF